VLRQREHLAALEPLDSALVLTTLRYAHEIRSPKDLDLPAGRGGGSERELALARQLVDSLSDTWDPREYRDTYDEVLRRLIAAKARGEEITAPEEPARPRVVDLASALRESLKAGRRPLARAGARRRPARRPGGGGAPPPPPPRPTTRPPTARLARARAATPRKPSSCKGPPGAVASADRWRESFA
jgi:DNA end-binding protein Ku